MVPARPTASPPMRWRALGIGFALATSIARLAHAHDPAKGDPDHDAAPKKDAAPEDVTVRADKPASEASSRVVVGGKELGLRPRLRPADILEATPGLFAVQHAGGGKANQYFLRGFDADHGTDVGFFVDGVPVNMPSHAHGQGYTDFHFLIPELVLSLDAFKGPYYASFGDFSTAGALDLKLVEEVPESYAQMQLGQYGFARGVVIASPHLADHLRTTIAVELAKQDGPFVNPERLGRLNVFLRGAYDVDEHSKLVATWMSYASTWNGSGQIPARAVCGEGEAGLPPPSAYGAPCLDHFGYVDPTEGGASHRHQGSLQYTWKGRDVDLRAQAYLVSYGFNLYSNFTFFDRHPLGGDEIEQVDGRYVTGADVRLRHHVHVGRSTFQTSVGVQSRFDAIQNGLFDDVARVRKDRRIDAWIEQHDLGLWFEEDARLFPWLRLVSGLRVERVDAFVRDQVAGSSDAAGQFGLSPKFLAAITPHKTFTLFASYGRGFHTNDARGVVQKGEPARLVTPANGWEVGARFSPIKGLQLSATAFLLDLDSELVWSGDEGTTEASGRTRRAGIELDARYKLAEWLTADVDATFTSARFRDLPSGQDEVPLAPRRTFSIGFGARKKLGDFTPFLAVRVKSLASRPANEDGSLVAEGFTIVDANGGLRWKNVELGIDAQNLFNTTWREVSFATTSRLPYEPTAVTGIHYTAGWPLTVIGRVAVYWP